MRLYVYIYIYLYIYILKIYERLLHLLEYGDKYSNCVIPLLDFPSRSDFPMYNLMGGSTEQIQECCFVFSSKTGGLKQQQFQCFSV